MVPKETYAKGNIKQYEVIWVVRTVGNEKREILKLGETVTINC